MRVRIQKARGLSARLSVPGDKSVSHRALLFGALAEGECEVDNLSPGGDVQSTARCLQEMGVAIAVEPGCARIVGAGLSGLTPPVRELDCGNSGTTLRLLSGIVAGAGFATTLSGDHSLQRRPMKRVLEPLRRMGALASGRPNAQGDECAPLRFEKRSQPLQGQDHILPVASAQVKSALLLAGLFAEGVTRVREPELSRDHTERMLHAYGAPVAVGSDGWISVRAPERPLLAPRRIEVPGDPSSAAFWIAAALLVPTSDVVIEGVDANPTRLGFVRVLQRMGGDVVVEPAGERAGDPIATVRISGKKPLRATTIDGPEIPSLVDEVTLLAILASQAEGETRIRGASELRVKESDRLRQVTLGLRAMGAEISELSDGLVIRGRQPLHGAQIDAASDHRIAMGFAVAGLCAEGETEVDGAEWADISYPGFFARLGEASGGAVVD
ncbi:MAG: 3-phosphoshikimate 1-carboxyvinyltransferase [Myxococcaceae bacterium]